LNQLININGLMHMKMKISNELSKASLGKPHINKS